MLQNFIKTIWVAGLMKSLEKAHVFASLANREYQGQIQSLGDKVRILGVSEVPIKNYSRDSDIDVPTDAQDWATELEIDQAYYFNFKVNDVDAVQRKPEVLSQLTQNAGNGFRDKVDLHFSSKWADAGYQIYSTGTTPYTVTSLNVDDAILHVKEVAGKNNLPTEGRFMVVPEWFHNKLVLAGLIVKTNNDELFANGRIGRVLGFDMYLSNNISESSPNTDVKIIAGVKNQSLSFADSINSIEAYRPEKRFEDAVKGLYIFGGKIMRPDMTLCLHATKGAEA